MTTVEGGIVLTAKAILFDNDGVLSDSINSVDACWREWAGRHDLDAERVLEFIHGRPARESIRLLAPDLDVEAAFLELEDLEVADATGVRPMPGAIAATRAVPRDRWAVVTSGTLRLAAARFAAIGIDPPAVITADDVTAGKPDPEPYLAAAAAVGAEPADCVVFEDTAPGVTAAQRAGAAVVGVVGNPGTDIGADYHIADLSYVNIRTDGSRLQITVR